MEARSVLQARVAALRRDLLVASDALRSDAIRADFRERVGVLFSNFIERKTADLDELARDIQKASATNGSLESHWRRFDQHGDECERLLKAYLAFLEGALVRSAQLDHGVCDLADAFLRQLAHATDIPWTRFTIVSDGDFYAPLTDIIQVRYPRFSVWNLPVLAHEFGHFITGRLFDRLLGEDPLARLGRDVQRAFEVDLPGNLRDGEGERARAHFKEFVADAFAAYAAGPAYTCACIMLSFEPAHADEDTSSHPSDRRRAYLLLRALEADGSNYQKLAQKLRSMWEESLEAAERPATVTPEPWLDSLGSGLSHILQTVVPKAKVSAADWNRAVILSQSNLSAHDRAAAAEMTPRDILNAAWLRRLSGYEAEASVLDQKALELFRQILPQASESTG